MRSLKTMVSICVKPLATPGDSTGNDESERIHAVSFIRESFCEHIKATQIPSLIFHPELMKSPERCSVNGGSIKSTWQYKRRKCHICCYRYCGVITVTAFMAIQVMDQNHLLLRLSKK